MICEKRMKLIRYGAEDFDPSRILPIQNSVICGGVKPCGGLWTSPANSEYGWAEWCRDQDFGLSDLMKSFFLIYRGRTLVVDSLEDCVALPRVYLDETRRREVVDFESLTLQVDAIHLTLAGEKRTRYTDPGLYGWDCESVLVLNPHSLMAFSRSDDSFTDIETFCRTGQKVDQEVEHEAYE
jgi:hypothetical protein